MENQQNPSVQQSDELARLKAEAQQQPQTIVPPTAPPTGQPQPNDNNVPTHLAPGLRPETSVYAQETMDDLDKEIAELKAAAEAKAAEDARLAAERAALGEDQEDDLDADQAVIRIEKIGMGHVINFTDEERAKLERVSKIRVEEVETVQLGSIKRKRSKKKDADVEKIVQRATSVLSTNIIAPLSGYTAVLNGCSPQELLSLAAGTNNPVVDQQTRWSTIYSKLDATSIGKFGSFDDFLKRTAQGDYSIFLYGVICSTFPDEDKLPIKCQKENCGHEYEHVYTVQSLLRQSSISQKLIGLISNAVDNSLAQESAMRAHEGSPVNTVTTYRLPASGIVVDIYTQSAHEFINRSIKGIKDDIDPKYAQSSILSVGVKTVCVPDKDSDPQDPEYFEYDSAMDVTKAIYNLKTADFRILTKLIQDNLTDTTFEFGISDITCPKCGEYTEFLPIDLDDILFHRYQQDMNTDIE